MDDILARLSYQRRYREMRLGIFSERNDREFLSGQSLYLSGLGCRFLLDTGRYPYSHNVTASRTILFGDQIRLERVVTTMRLPLMR